MTGPGRHIAIFVPSLRGGGAERVMVTLANGFASAGHRVDLVLARAEGPYLADLADGVRLVNLDQPRVLKCLGPLARYLRRDRPEALLSAMGHANIVAILARKLARGRTRLVVSEHNSLTRAPSGVSGRIIRALMRSLYPMADRVVCVSGGMARDLQRRVGLPAAKIATIHNPVEIERIQKDMTAPVDHPWIKDRAAPVILAAGRLTEQKDYPTLLRAFAQIRAQRPTRLIILGQGEEKARLTALAIALGLAPDTDLVGFQDNPFAWMSGCDLFVLSSAWEGFGNVLVEAMVCGARVVSTDCPSGPNEILENGRWGRLVPVGDAGALAQAMAEALDDANPPDARDRVTAFRSEAVIDQYAQVLLS